MLTLKEIQNKESNILKEFSNICKKNEIPFYLAGGTLLGAVRHKGFIPWDDDIDVNVLLSDLKKIRKIFKYENKYDYIDYKNQKGYQRIWSRMKDDTPYSQTRLNGEIIEGIGLWIDIIPLIKAAKNEKSLKRQVKLLYAWSYCVRNQMNIKTTKYSSFINKMYRIIREIFVYRFGGELILCLAKLMQSKRSQKYIVLDVKFFDEFNEENFKRIKKILVKEQWMKNPSELPFEGEKYPSFSDYHNYLVDHYGEDYMTPIKERAHINYTESTDSLN